jgi:hypothetical protein
MTCAGSAALSPFPASPPAQRAEQGAPELIAAVEGLSAAEWATIRPDEPCRVGVLVHHIGAADPHDSEII